MHDIHIHTTLSKCAKEDAQFSDYQSKFKDLSLTVVGFTNHLWDKNVANASLWYTGQDVEHVFKLKEDIAKYQGDKVKIYFGCEIEYIGNNIASLTPKNAKLFDYVLVPPHHFHMVNFVRPESINSGKELSNLFFNRFMEVCDIDFAFGIAHPFVPLGFMDNGKEVLSSLSLDKLADCFGYAAKKNKSIEINYSCLQDMQKRGFLAEYQKIMSIAQKCNCIFHIGSDAHSKEEINNDGISLALSFAQSCNITIPDNPFAK